MRTTFLGNNAESLIHRECLLVRAFRNKRVIHICNRHNAGRKRYILTLQAFRIASRAIPPFVVTVGNFLRHLEVSSLAQVLRCTHEHIAAIDRMLLHFCKFIVRQLARLIQNHVRNVNLADIMKRSRHRNRRNKRIVNFGFLAAILQFASNEFGISRRTAHMATRRLVAIFHHIAKHRNDVRLESRNRGRLVLGLVDVQINFFDRLDDRRMQILNFIARHHFKALDLLNRRPTPNATIVGKMVHLKRHFVNRVNHPAVCNQDSRKNDCEQKSKQRRENLRAEQHHANSNCSKTELGTDRIRGLSTDNRDIPLARLMHAWCNSQNTRMLAFEIMNVLVKRRRIRILDSVRHKPVHRFRQKRCLMDFRFGIRLVSDRRSHNRKRKARHEQERRHLSLERMDFVLGTITVFVRAARNRIKRLDKPARRQANQHISHNNRNELIRNFRAEVRQNLRQKNRKPAFVQSRRNRRHHIFGNFKVKKEVRKHRTWNAQNHQHSKQHRQTCNSIERPTPCSNPCTHGNHHVNRAVVERRRIDKTANEVRQEPNNRARAKPANHRHDNRTHAIQVQRQFKMNG